METQAFLNAHMFGMLTAVFFASAVECIEALTIVLAMGMTRSWKSALVGTALAMVALAAVVAVAGVALQAYVSKSLLQLIIGTLLLVFGLQWLRKAIMRSSGLTALHDETVIFKREREKAANAGSKVTLGMDWFAFVVSFKGVLLEGLEVIFIVVSFGLSAGAETPNSLLLASMSALTAALVVVVLGFVAKGPLSKVPENILKFGVAVLLCTFGVFWASEGLGYFTKTKESLEWPGGDWALPFVLASWIVVSLLAVSLFKQRASPKAVPGGKTA
ncbi:MAG: COG4280 domain-containing protein [Rectinemataceae bacterium]